MKTSLCTSFVVVASSALLLLTLTISPAAESTNQPAGEITPVEEPDTPVADSTADPTPEASPEEASPQEADPAEEAESTAKELLRSFLHLQEQVREAQLAMERTKVEAQAAAARNAAAITTKLQLIEGALAETRQQQYEALQASNRHIVTLAVIFAAAGFLALVLTSWLQWRTVARLSELSMSASHPLALPDPTARQVLSSGSGAAASSQLMDALDRLEKRIADFEAGDSLTHFGPKAGGAQPSNGTVMHSQDTGSDIESVTDTQAPSQIMKLLHEGQELLAKDEADQAIAAFDEVLDIDPSHAEALLRKGTALERLRKNQEAIECYDRAIAADSHMTMAYLYKGGLFNRMERFNEAMECYELALRVQEGQVAAS